MDNLIKQLNKLHLGDTIVLKDGRKINVSDIARVDSAVEFDDMVNTLNKIFTFSESNMTLDDWVNYLQIHHKEIISSTLDVTAALDRTNNKVIKNNGKWIYHEVIFKRPLKYTVVNFNDNVRYLYEPVYMLNTLIAFVNNIRPIADIFNINDGNDIWWDALDYTLKQNIRNIPVTIKTVRKNDCDFKTYCNTMGILFDIPQLIQHRIVESLYGLQNSVRHTS